MFEMVDAKTVWVVATVVLSVVMVSAANALSATRRYDPKQPKPSWFDVHREIIKAGADARFLSNRMLYERQMRWVPIEAAEFAVRSCYPRPRTSKALTRLTVAGLLIWGLVSFLT